MNRQLIKLWASRILSVVVVFLLVSCVSQKKKGEVSKLGKFYHNTTAHYNGYFNANELVVASIESLREQHQDNYNEILPIYVETETNKPETIAEDMNKAIEKVSIVATVHEPSQWVDDCYIMLGQAQYYLQDYETAEETFEYFIEEFDPSITRRKSRGVNKKKKSSKKKSTSKKKKRKKKKKKPRRKKKKKKKKKETKAEREARLEREKFAKEQAEAEAKRLENTTEIDRGKSGLFKHQSAFPEGLLWLSRTYAERDKFNLVEYYLNKIGEQAEVKPEVLKEVPAVHAYSALKQEEYTDAVNYLEEAILLEKNKKRRARLIFIQSQIYEKLGNKQRAFQGFNKVIDMKPDFIMEFNAALKMLKSSMGSGEESIASVKAKLEKMLKEEKFDQFQDQIYYTLGEIYYEQKNEEEAIPNFRKSIKYNSGNDVQLVESYYILANIFYDREDYVMSKNYYDSTSTVIPKADSRFFEVEAFSKNLTAIAENILTIELQDSLIRISKMTPEEQAELANKLKKEQLLAEAKAKEDDDDLPTSNIRSIPANRLGTRLTTFFAYDDVKKEQGKFDFAKVWGSRLLEDDWRRSNKSSGDIAIDDFDAGDDLSLTEDEIQEILKNVPMTENALAQSKSKIRGALFELGVLFRERIQNYPKSIEAHKSLQERFPGSEKEPDALYYLYLSHNDIDDQPGAQYYLNQLKTKYPEEKYTLALTDPTYVDNFLKETKIQENSYDETYALFEQGKFQEVLLREAEAKEKYPENLFVSKYALLGAMATGSLEGSDAYMSALKKMIATYPNTPEQTRAKEILRFLKGDQEAFIAIDENEALADFALADDKLHYVIVVINSKNGNDLNSAKISISNYNRKYHSVERIKVSSSTLNKDNNVQTVLLRKFKNKDDAMKYYKEITRQKKEFMEPKVNYEVFPITQQNFREIMKKKSIKEYEVFFNENYL